MNAPARGCFCADCVRAARLAALKVDYLAGRGTLERLAVAHGVSPSDARRIAVAEAWRLQRDAAEQARWQRTRGLRAVEAAVAELGRAGIAREDALAVLLGVAASLALEGVDPRTLEVA